MSTVLLLNNDDVEKLLTIKDTIRALDEAYLELDKGEKANRHRTFTLAPGRLLIPPFGKGGKGGFLDKRDL